jgi:alpha-tubulin suppressor-like RCC1 family protein
MRVSLLTLGVLATTALACTDRDAAHTSTPALKFRSIVAGNLFTCGVDTARVLWCWGSNEFGQIGVGDQVDRREPVRVPLSGPVERVVAGDGRVCAVDTLATLRCWGDNTLGALMLDAQVPIRTAPVVMEVGRVRQVAPGSRVTCATDLAGSARCWGGDRSGERGDGADTTGARTTAAPVVGNVAFDTLVAGRTHVCGLSTGGDAWCWGGEGLVGDGSREIRTVPTAVAGGHRFRSLTAGQSATCGLTADGIAWCWGIAYDGQLGAGDNFMNPFVPVAVVGAHRFTQLTAGHHRVCGLDVDGLAWCWGTNFNGALGDSASVASTRPVRVHGNRRYVAIASGDTHACALDTSGHAWCWGQNSRGDGGGALGDGTSLNRSFPARVLPPPPPAVGAEPGAAPPRPRD